MKNQRLAGLLKRDWMPLLSAGLLSFAAFTSGCSEFCETTELSNGLTEVHYDETLPNALEGVFGECNDPLVIASEMDSIELADGCSFSDLDGDGEIILALGLASQSPIDLGGEIPSLVHSDEWSFTDFPWPVQNCEMTIGLDVYFDQLKMTDLQANWTTFQGQPSMHVDLDFTENKVGEITIDVDVDCPSSLSEWLVNVFTGKVQNALEGTHDIKASNRDLDINVMLDHNTVEVLADLDVDFSVGNLWIPLDWDSIDKYIDRDDVEEPARELFESVAGDLLQDSLTMIPELVADAMQSTVPEGHQICSLERDGDGVTITTDEPNGFMTCNPKIIHKYEVQSPTLSKRAKLSLKK